MLKIKIQAPDVYKMYLKQKHLEKMKENDKKILSSKYKTRFCYSYVIFRQNTLYTEEITEIYRITIYTDQKFNLFIQIFFTVYVLTPILDTTDTAVNKIEKVIRGKFKILNLRIPNTILQTLMNKNLKYKKKLMNLP